MKKIFLIIAISNLLVKYSFGQESYIKERWNFKAGLAQYNIGSRNLPNYWAESNYGVSNNIETGVYAGYSRSTFYYGINCNFHLFPFLIKEDDFRFDLYVTGKLGGIYQSYFIKTRFVDYSIGGGFSFYLLKHIGLFTEYSYGKLNLRNSKMLRFGLTMKF